MKRFAGPELRALRDRFGVSQAKMAKMLDVQRSTLVRWEASAEMLPVLVRLALTAWTFGLPPMGSFELRGHELD